MRWASLDTIWDGYYKLLARLTSPFKKPEPKIDLTENGFSVVNGKRLAFRVTWADVSEVFAYKQDRLSWDRICVGFRVSERNEEHVVDEDMIGYAQFLEDMKRVFPDMKKDWWSEVAFPAFATNYTILWSAPPKPASDA